MCPNDWPRAVTAPLTALCTLRVTSAPLAAAVLRGGEPGLVNVWLATRLLPPGGVRGVRVGCELDWRRHSTYRFTAPVSQLDMLCSATLLNLDAAGVLSEAAAGDTSLTRKVAYLLQRCQHDLIYFLSFSDMAPEGAVDRLVLHLELTRTVTSWPGHDRATAESRQHALPPLRLHVWARVIVRHHRMLAAAGPPAQLSANEESKTAAREAWLAEGWGSHYARTSTAAVAAHAAAKRARVQRERQLRLLELLAHQVLRA